MSIWQRVKKVPPQRLAQAIVIGVLAGAMLVGWAERQEKSAADIQLDNLPAQLQAWHTTDEELKVSGDADYKLLTRTYENEDGRRASVVVQATYTRLGSLRDWDLAGMAGGWSVTGTEIWHNDLEPGAAPDSARIQTAIQGDAQIVTLSWYTSTNVEAPTLQDAEFAGWRQRLLGHGKPWASLRIVCEDTPDARAQETVRELSTLLAPHIREFIHGLRVTTPDGRG